MGHLVMSDKERQRTAWMLMVDEGTVTLCKAREALGVSYRQAKRIYQRYITQGDEGLKSRQIKPVKIPASRRHKLKNMSRLPHILAQTVRARKNLMPLPRIQER